MTGMIVGNFTPDDIDTMYIGVTRTFKVGQVLDIPDAEGNHILDRFAIKGLVRLEWGGNEDGYRKESMSRWERFWERQVTDFNQLNEKLKAEKKGYIYPTETLKAHADKLGLSIIQPWVIHKSEDKELADLKGENREMRLQMSNLMDRLAELTQAIVPHEGEKDNDALRNQFKFRNAQVLEAWVLSKSVDILDWPSTIRGELIEKWESTYKNKPWPLPLKNGDTLGGKKRAQDKE